ncbi:MAG TPA: exonuclease domain-containing protein [Ktedonobacteraceae bacterium]|nr:exonuclease domain-containing protein [Ktedonobacteraceae bacterium]
MAKQPPIRVALDLETTGLHAEQDAILEVAAIKFQGETILDKMETLVAPGRPIPFRVQRLTGITPQSVANAPTFDAIANKLQRFLGEYPLVGHSIPFDAGFLRRRGLVRNNPLIDTFELATVLLPSLPSYGLGHVAQALGVPVAPGRHRAMVDTVLAMDVFLALHRLLEAVDTPILKGLAHLDAPRSWPLLGFFRQEWRERMEADGLQHGALRGSLGDQFAAQLGMDPRILSFAIARQQESDTITPNLAPAVLPGDPSMTTNLPISGMVEVETALAGLEQSPGANALQTLVEVIPEEVKQEASTHAHDGQLVRALHPPGDRDAPTTHRHAGYQTAYSAIQRALNERTPLLLEVTVGANDYSPALLPALEWLANAHKGVPVAPSAPPCLVVAVATAQGARRLVERVLPRLQTSLQSAFPVAYLAERGGYLCIHRWFGPALRRTSGELTAEQARGVAKLAIWAQQTQSGERSELTLLPQEIAAWERISSGVEHVALADSRAGTPFERCLYRKNGYCFSSRAEERVKQASIVVTTHAGLLDDLTSPRSLLKGIPHRLILDADLLEEECARWSNEELDYTRLRALLHTIGTELPDGRYQGLLAVAAPTLSEDGPGGLSTMPTVEKSALDSGMLTWFQSLRQAQAAIDGLFKALGQLLQEGANGGMRDKGKQENASRGYSARGAERTDQPYRLTPQMRNLASWLEVERAWQLTAQRLKAVMHVLDEAQTTILSNRKSRRRFDPGSGEEESIAWELAELANRLLKQKKLAERALSLGKDAQAEQEDTSVYWLRMPPPVMNQGQPRSFETSVQPAQSVENMPVLHAQNSRIASFIKTHLLPKGVGAVLAGVALSVDHNFSYYRGRYGLDADSCPALSVVTEYQQQTLLYMPNDVPEPNAPQYQRHLDEAITHLATTLDGQLVVLFTSYAALRSSYAAVKPLLEAKDILVLGHGIDGSPRQLWQMFSDQARVVLLGTGSFWDGIDEVSRPPTCVLVARLPMPVLNDPPFAARVEHYSDQLHQVTVPIASLRVRRALNRLAWSDTRRNAVVLFDRRVLSKEYGSTVINTLPQCSQRQGGLSHMPEIVLDWLTATGAWD